MSASSTAAARSSPGLRAAAAWAASVLAAGAGVVLLAARTATLGATAPLLVVSAGFGLLGALITGLRPANPVGWSFAGGGLLFVLGLLAEQYARYGLVVEPGSVPGADTALWLQSWLYPVPPGSGQTIVSSPIRTASRRWHRCGG